MENLQYGSEERIIVTETAGPILAEKKNPSNHWLLPASILLAGMLIAGAQLYTNKLTLEFYEKQSSLSQAEVAQPQAQNPTQQAVPTVQALVAKRQDAPVIGSQSAKVTIEEFSDFQCPFCKSFYDQALKQIREEYVKAGKVKIVFRHYPLAFHARAEIAAVASECANRQGKFEAYHDLLFQNGQSDGKGLETENLKKYADSLGLNSGTLGLGKNKFNQCLDNRETLAVVQKDMADGNAAGVNGTPTSFVNGKKIVGAQSFASFKQLIDAELK